MSKVMHYHLFPVKAFGIFGKAVDTLVRSLGSFGGFLMIVMSALTVYEVVSRYVFNSPTIFTLEISIYLITIFVFFTLAYAQRNSKHIRVDLIISQLPERTRVAVDIVTLVLCVLIVGLITYYGWNFALISIVGHEKSDSLLSAPLWPAKLAVPVGGFLLILQYLKDIATKLKLLFTHTLEKGKGVLANLIFVLTSLLLALLFSFWLFTKMPEAALIVLLFVVLLAGIPVFAALAMLGGFGLFLLEGSVALPLLPVITYNTYNSFSLACLPLYFLAGHIISTSGMGRELYDFSAAWLGRIPGGLAVATTVACGIFAAMSASSVACAAAIGMVAIPELVRHKYNKRFALGVVAGGGTLGLMIPPGGDFIIYSAITDESLGQLFIAGVIPGIMLLIMYAGYCFIRCLRTREYQQCKVYSWKDRIHATKKALPVLIAPTITLLGIYSGVCTALETAGVLVIYVLIVALVMRRIKISQLMSVSRETTATATMVMAIIFGALLLGHLVTLLNIPQKLISTIAGAGVQPILVVVGVIVIYLIMGCFLEGVSIITITMPVFYPLLVTSLGFNGLWVGVILTVCMEMAMLTPPVGMNCFVIQAISGAPFSEVARGVIPYIYMLLVAIVLLLLFPQLATWLPATMSVNR